MRRKRIICEVPPNRGIRQFGEVMWVRRAGWIAVALAMATSGTVSCADDKSPDEVSLGQRLVNSALEFELEGDSRHRKLALDAAVQRSPECAPAHWQLGEVLVDGQWTLVADAMALRADDEVISTYQRKRAQAGGNAEAEAKVARWCEEQGFEDRARLHWRRIVANPAAAERELRQAVKTLNLQQLGDAVLDQREVEQLEVHRDRLAHDFNTWSKKIEKWTKALTSDRDRRREKALAELRAVREPGAVLALELLLSPLSKAAAAEVVGVLEKIDGHDASESLARHALGAPWPSVAQQAAIALKYRPKHEYVPLLLEALRSPIQTSFRITDLDGYVRYERLVFTEGVDANYLLAYSSGANPVRGYRLLFDDGRPQQAGALVGARRVPESNTENTAVRTNDNRAIGPMLARAQAQMRAFREQRQLDSANAAVTANNVRVFSALATSTNEVLPDQPADWWDWWREYNEVNDYYGPKPTYYDYRWYQYAYDATYTQIKTVDPTDWRVSPFRLSCFREGTPVWTETGKRPIETIQAGDRVLSQDPDSGELEFKIVINRTVRPPKTIVRLVVGGEGIECTKGHPFWVNGTGWKMAKLVSSEDRLHAIDGSATVDEVAEQPYRDSAYNLIVDDFGTYFVGEIGALVHDNTYRKPTTAVVPGL